MHLRLVAFDDCPYVQRSLIVLLQRDADYDLDLISRDPKPEWLWDISPRGKVPVLVADGEAVFESHAIVEYLDEVLPGERLMSTDPLERARDRAWFAFASDAIYPKVHQLLFSKFPRKFRMVTEDLVEQLGALEGRLEGREWVSGDGTAFGIADLALAPAATRLALLQELGVLELPDTLPRFASWMVRVLALPAVAASPPPTFRETALRRMADAGSQAVRR